MAGVGNALEANARVEKYQQWDNPLLVVLIFILKMTLTLMLSTVMQSQGASIATLPEQAENL